MMGGDSFLKLTNGNKTPFLLRSFPSKLARSLRGKMVALELAIWSKLDLANRVLSPGEQGTKTPIESRFLPGIHRGGFQCNK